jgi:glycosyltransferase involved in cell wall biosynthesis
MVTGDGRQRRAVLLVANAAAPYSRSTRVARSLVAAGWEVEIAATTGSGQPMEEWDGPIRIRRYAPSGPLARFDPGHTAAQRRPRGRVGSLLDIVVKVIAWPVHVRAWWATLRRDLPPADLYHAFGILTIGIAVDLARKARGAGFAGMVVYDVIDVMLESNNVDRLPRPVVSVYRRIERGWVGGANAVVTVNDAIADHLAHAWALDARPTVLLNCQPRWQPPAKRPDLIHPAAGLPPERRIVLFLGRLGRERGLEEAAAAVLRLDEVALVMLGFGPWAERLRERDRDPRFAGRHVTLPAVHPDDVPLWAASADVTIVAVPAHSLNQRLSTPNKFWESLAAGTPMVVGRDLVVMREIVERERIGAVADPTDPADIARALSVILDAPPAERAAMRARNLSLARDRYNWEQAVRRYLVLVDRLVAQS